MRESGQEVPLELAFSSSQNSCYNEIFLKSVTGLDLSSGKEINARLFLANFYRARAGLGSLYIRAYNHIGQVSFKERALQILRATPIGLSGWAQTVVRDPNAIVDAIIDIDNIEQQAEIAQLATNLFIVDRETQAKL